MHLNERYRDSCTNEKLVEKGEFIVKKVRSTGTDPPDYTKYDWEFQAILENTGLSTLKAKVEGVCSQVDTLPGSLQCGLATSLMQFCFWDADIGTVNPATHYLMERPRAETYRNHAIENCDHIIFLICAPVKLPYAACSGYLTAAINTGHTMMFTFYYGDWNALTTSSAKLKFKSNADNFITGYGDTWFFCKCKPNRVTECEGM